MLVPETVGARTRPLCFLGDQAQLLCNYVCVVFGVVGAGIESSALVAAHPAPLLRAFVLFYCVADLLLLLFN